MVYYLTVMRLRLAATVCLSVMLIGCNNSVKEVSTECDSVKLPILLDASEPLIQKGFGENQTRQIEDTFRLLGVSETKQLNFSIVYRGIETELRIRVKKEDVDAVEVHFSCVSALAEQIQLTIRRTPLD